jgi:hypothetical protein
LAGQAAPNIRLTNSSKAKTNKMHFVSKTGRWIKRTRRLNDASPAPKKLSVIGPRQIHRHSD